MSACGRAGVAPQPPGLRDQPGPLRGTHLLVLQGGGGRGTGSTRSSQILVVKQDLSCLQESGTEVFLDSLQTPERSGETHGSGEGRHTGCRQRCVWVTADFSSSRRWAEPLRSMTNTSEEQQE